VSSAAFRVPNGSAAAETDRRAWLRSALARGAQAAPTDVTIAKVETFRMDDALFVKVTASDGSVGWGETDADNPPIMDAFIQNGLRQRVTGQSIWDAERLWDTMFYRQHDHGPGGALAGSISGIDIACWDLRARLLGLSVSQLLGGRYRERIRAYGSFGVGFGRNMTVEQAVAQARTFIAQGFTAVKLRMQMRELNQDSPADPVLTYARAVREAIGPQVDLLVDINNGYSAARGIVMARRLREEFNILFLEEPVSDQTHAETAAVVRAVDVPIIAGEKEYTRWQLRELIVMGQPDILNPDTIKAGGLTEMKKIAVIADTYGKPIICHNTRPTLGTAASLHFIAAIPNCGPLIEFVDVTRHRDLIGCMRRTVVFADGHLQVPTGPGLGVEVDETAVRRRVVR
jgi:L-alanine-DL-glutamate epimerase-like enolase superfamily enzyme